MGVRSFLTTGEQLSNIPRHQTVTRSQPTAFCQNVRGSKNGSIQLVRKSRCHRTQQRFPRIQKQVDWRKPWNSQVDLARAQAKSHCQGDQPVFCNVSDFAWASTMGTSRLIGFYPYLKAKGRDQRPRNIAGIRSRAWMPSICETTFTSIPAR